MNRRGFTLVELLVSILIIGLLAGIIIGTLGKATTRSKEMKTEATIAKLHQQIMTKWESYRFRRLPVDPNLLLASLSTGDPIPQATNAWAFIQQLVAQRAMANDPLNIAPGDKRFPSAQQVAATKLLIMRELQRYEMPQCWADIIDSDPSTKLLNGTPGSYSVRTPNILLAPPQLAISYVNRVNMACKANAAIDSLQLQEHETAECLYLIIKMACEDDNTSLAGSVKEIGDFDGDGLSEFQDAFGGMDQKYPTNAPTNGPIMFCRWPAGFTNYNRGSATGTLIDSTHVSNYQDDPYNVVQEAVGNQGGAQTSTALMVMPQSSVPPPPTVFAADNHDYFDTLKLDMPNVSTLLPRGFQLTPLIYSAGPDSTYGITLSAWVAAADPSGINDPYFFNPISGNQEYNAQWHPAGSYAMTDGVSDNITNHNLSGR